MMPNKNLEEINFIWVFPSFVDFEDNLTFIQCLIFLFGLWSDELLPLESHTGKFLLKIGNNGIKVHFIISCFQFIKVLFGFS